MADVSVNIDADISTMSEKELIKLVNEQPEVLEAKKALASEGAEYARSIAPVADADHTLKSGYVDKAGAYRDSIYVSVKGTWVAIVATDYKAHWIEYGTETMPERAVFKRTEKYLNGRNG